MTSESSGTTVAVRVPKSLRLSSPIRYSSSLRTLIPRSAVQRGVTVTPICGWAAQKNGTPTSMPRREVLENVGKRSPDWRSLLTGNIARGVQRTGTPRTSTVVFLVTE
jgi:hypothetical protein